MSSLPFPVRVAAGLVVTAVEEVRDLPRTVVGLPITAVSRVRQLSMRAQQVVTELAIKGDVALEGSRPVEEAPSWARFDDDGGADAPRGRVALATSPYDRAGGSGWDDTLDDTSLEFTGLAGSTRTPGTSGATNGHAATNGHLAAVASGSGSGSVDTATDTAADAADDGPALGEATDTASVTPDALPGYETLTIAQLRGRLRSLDVDQLTELLAWESSHADRPPFVTMLTNRIATLTAEG